MKKLLLTLLWPCAAFSQDWSALDKSLLTAGATLHILDWQQTRYISGHPNEFYEINPLLGKHPSQARVNQYMLGTLVLYPLLADWLPEYRTVILSLWVGSRGIAVHNNYVLGVKLNW